MAEVQTVAERLAKFVCDLDFRRLPSEVVRRAKEHVLDQLGCQLLGSTVPWNRPVYEFVRRYKPGGPATIIGHGDRVPPDDAALVNGTFGQGCELDDYYDQGGGHPGAASVAVAMALAEVAGFPGRDFITAIVGGYEIGWRVGRGLLPGMMRRGYHSQGVVGVFIAAATAGKILRLDASSMSHALAIAGSHAGGTMEYDQTGGEVKRLHSGMACCGGMRSAALAGMGLTGPRSIFEGERGILKVFGDQERTEVITDRLGDEFAVTHAAIKRFPVNASQHSPIEALSKLIEEHSIRPEQVECIRVHLNEGVILHGGSIYEPNEVIQAQFSLRFSLALRLLKGNNNLEHYLNPRLWHDQAILAIGRKIELVADPTATGKRRFACTMRISLKGGRTVESSIVLPKGTLENPFSTEEVRRKFLQLGAGAVDSEKLEKIVEFVDTIEAAKNVGALASLLVREAPGV
ncbi:MAG TPA: MmgE/PrpD family protein [candidate division Zixibacteria bacterium]|nr:MmgE/PrpD family protein [candidate division Zixibacteria bacterium]